MPKTLRRRIFDYVASALLLVLPIFILRANTKEEDQHNALDKAILRISSPLQSGVDWVVGGIGGLWYGYIALTDVEEENEELRTENRTLRAALIEAQLQATRSQELTKLAGLKQSRADDTVAARVVAMSLSPHFEVVRIALDRDDVEPGMPVIATLRRDPNHPDRPSYALVGRISRVYTGYAEVLLVNDPKSVIGVWIPRTGAKGKLQGNASEDYYDSELQNLQRQQVQKGDLVVTRGLGQFPEGIPVGFVPQDPVAKADISLRVAVESFVDVSELRHVLVVTWRPPPSDPKPRKMSTSPSPRAYGVQTR